MVGTIVAVVIIAVLVMFVIGIYNKLVRLRNAFKNAFAQIDVQLKRRYDLIPNLVETAKAFMAHEKDTLEAVIQARNGAVNAQKNVGGDPSNPEAVKGLLAAEAQLTGSMGKLFALFENYPDIKSNTTMNNLMEELTSTENKVSFARQHYNDSVMVYNTAKEVFPAVLFAGMFGFLPAQLFEVDAPEERQAVKVAF